MGIQLLLRLSGAYIITLFFGTLILIFNNKVIYQISLAEQLRFMIKAIVIGDLLILALLILLTALRLRKVITYFQEENGSQHLQIVQRLVNFPTELFWGMMAIALLFSGLFHFAQWLVEKEDHLNQKYWVELLHTLIAEQLLALTLAMLLYSVLRKFLRPFIAKLKVVSIEGLSYSSMINPLLITFASVLLYILFNMYRYIVHALSSGQEPQIGILLLIALAYFAFGLLLFLWHVLEMKEHLQQTTTEIRSLLSGGRTHMHTPMLVLANDEVGKLTTIFNQLQQKIGKDYDELEKEKQLAANVQQKLFTSPIKVNNVLIPNPSLTEEGTVFYDQVALDNRHVFLKGYVSSKGMPAAIMISAILVIFRTEIQRVQNPSKVLAYLQKQFNELVKELEITVTLEISER